MEEGRGWLKFDSSAYVLLESIGDSEAECVDASLAAETDESHPAEDDAQSCSYESTPETDSSLAHDVIDADGDDDCRGGDFDEGDIGEWSDDEDGVVEQCRRRDESAPTTIEISEKSIACENFEAKATSDKDRDKLFWDTCLAS